MLLGHFVTKYDGPRPRINSILLYEMARSDGDSVGRLDGNGAVSRCESELMSSAELN